MTQNSSDEKRRHPRVEQSVPLKISTPDADLVAETSNISCSGVYCRVSKFIEPMTKLGVTLLLPVKKGGKTTTRKITCYGVVVRTENIPNQDDFNTAIFFSDIHSKDSRLLGEYVESVLAEKSKSAAN